MAKAKQKRQKRELEKLQRAGRHPEWLAAAQDQPTTPELKRNIDKAWIEIRRRTLRTREAFEEYCRLRPDLGPIPQTPENLFLEALADLMAHPAGPADTLLAVTGLSGGYQAAQRQVGAFLQEQGDWREAEKLLQRMAHSPEKMSRKQYQNLAECFADTGLEEPFDVLAQEIMTFRKLNHKTHLHKELSDWLLDDLENAHHEVWDAVRDLPPVARRLVLLPFVEQVLLHLRQSVPSPGPHQVRALIQSVQRIFIDVVGPSLSDDLRRELIEGDEADCSDAACRQMEQQFAKASFEERLALLRDFRAVVQREVAREDEAFAQLAVDFDGGINETMERLLVHFYREVVGEIGRRMPELPARERRGLAAFWDRILAHDVETMMFPEADLKSLAQLVQQAIEAGCSGIRLALLAPFAAMAAGNRRLVAIAEQALQDCPAPAEADLQWFIGKLLPLALRYPAKLEFIFARIRDNEALVERLARAVRNEFNNGFVMAILVQEYRCFPFLADEEGPLFSRQALKELAGLAAHIPQLAVLRHFLQVVPDGRIGIESLRQWCELVWNPREGCQECIQAILALMHGAREGAAMADIMQLPDFSGKRQDCSVQNKRMLELVTDFLRSRSEDFQTMALSDLSNLVEDVFPFLTSQSEFSSLLIRTYNALCARVKAGEMDCIPLRDDIERQMRTKARASRRR
ncbi:MAG: hypothetical protein AB7E77_12410 [Desulfobulbus sp.]